MATKAPYLAMAQQRTFGFDKRVLCVDQRRDSGPLPHGRSRRTRNEYAGAVAARSLPQLLGAMPLSFSVTVLDRRGAPL